MRAPWRSEEEGSGVVFFQGGGRSDIDGCLHLRTFGVDVLLRLGVLVSSFLLALTVSVMRVKPLEK